jgi:hypothetical protein
MKPYRQRPEQCRYSSLGNRHNPTVRELQGSIADKLSKSGWSWGCVSAVERGGGAELFDFCDDVRAFFFASAGEDDLGAGAGEFDGRSLADAGGPPVTSATLPEKVLAFIELVLGWFCVVLLIRIV